MYDQAKLVAEVSGYEFNSALFARIRRLEQLALTDDAKLARAKKDVADRRADDMDMDVN